jgi:outer membrane receptor for monomeric catechols
MTLSIYPNPATDHIFVDGVQNIKSIKVYSILGCLEKEVFNTHKIEVSNLASGIYVVKVRNGTNVISKKFIKQ